MNMPRVGLLPLYLKFYDQVLPQLAGQIEPFAGRVSVALEKLGLTVSPVTPARTRKDCASALEHFESQDVDVIFTLHLAYAPSLEAAESLSSTALPLVMLDTTPDYNFGGTVDPSRLLLNHGIHGVQDLASVLRRMGKRYRVVAGHVDDPAFLSGCVGLARAARVAKCLRSTRALRIGGGFPAMGDFDVPSDVLERKLGITTHDVSPSALMQEVQGVSENEVKLEIESDHTHFQIECDPEVHQRSVRIGLGLRKFLELGRYGAFSLNFLSFQEATGPLSTVPFLECCKAMRRGIGYAGEGDVLTAALVGALARGFGETTFTEMFCADWSGGSLFLSHMGEVNVGAVVGRPVLYEKDYPFTPALNPATIAGALKPGTATLVNLAPGPNETFRLVTSPVEVLADGRHPDFAHWIRGWIRPAMPLPRFLEEFSHLGCTHHSALVFGDHEPGISALGTFLELEHCSLV